MNIKNTALRAVIAIPLAFGLMLTGCSADPDVKPEPTAAEQATVQTFTGDTVQEAMEAAGFTWLAPDRSTNLTDWSTGLTDYGVLLSEATERQVAVRWADNSLLLKKEREGDRYFFVGAVLLSGEESVPEQTVQEFGSPDTPFVEALEEAGAYWPDDFPVADEDQFWRFIGDGIELRNVADAGDVRIVFDGGELTFDFEAGRFYLED